jgi:myosin heavy subunit
MLNNNNNKNNVANYQAFKDNSNNNIVNYVNNNYNYRSDTIDDLSRLDNLVEKRLLKELYARYKNDQIYVCIFIEIILIFDLFLVNH